MTFQQAITTRYAPNDLKKIAFGTPQHVWHSMTRCWEVEPSSLQIVQDILDLPRVLTKIVEMKGVVVHGEALRNGHRARRGGDGSTCGTRSRQRKKDLTLRPVHPDAQKGIDRILRKENEIDGLISNLESVEDSVDLVYIINERDTDINEDIIDDEDILSII